MDELVVAVTIEAVEVTSGAVPLSLLDMPRLSSRLLLLFFPALVYLMWPGFMLGSMTRLHCVLSGEVSSSDDEVVGSL